MNRKTTQNLPIGPALTFILLFFVISACAQINSSPSDDFNENPKHVDQPSDDYAQDKVKQPKTIDEETKLPEESVDEEPEEPERIEIEYRIASNYDIRPLDENTNDRIVLLTFDDGPKDENLIDQMLDVLDKYNAKAIFFVNGYRVERNPHLLVQIYERGHVIGNHSWDHINLKTLDEESIDEQIDSVQQLVESLTGEKPKFFRPPFGSSNEYVREKINAEKMAYMNWSNGSEDWDKAYQYPEGVIERVMEQLRPGSNILMHELPWTVEALDQLLHLIQEEGYDFVHPLSIQTEDEA